MNNGKAITEQFYRWEQRGRGWHVFDSPIELEPVFEPFFGHFIDSAIIDDGKRLRWWQRLLQPAANESDVDEVNTTLKEFSAYPYIDQGEDVIYSVSITKGYTSNSSAIEQLLTMLALSKHLIAFEIIGTAQRISLQFSCKAAQAYWLYTQLHAFLPHCTITQAHTDTITELIDEANVLYTVDFGLSEEFMRPISSNEGKGQESYTALFGLINQLTDEEVLIVQLLFCGAINSWDESIIQSVTDTTGHSFFYNAPEMPVLAKDKISKPLVGATLRLVAISEYEDDAYRLLTHGAAIVQQLSKSPYNELIPLDSVDYPIKTRLEDIMLRQTHRIGMLLNIRELATLVHIPSAAISSKLFSTVGTTKQAPAFLTDTKYILGLNGHQGKELIVGINTQQRTRHLHVIGGSGVGKSTLLHSLITQDIKNNVGCCVLDPHGDLIEQVLHTIPQERIQDVVLIDPSDAEFPVSFNILSAHSDIERELLASDLVALFKRFSTSWGDNLHSVLANAIMAFLYNSRPGHLGELRKFLLEPVYRTTILNTCTDEELKYYWTIEYPLIKTSSIGSILTRLDSFLRPKVIRNMICQHKGLDIGALMDSNKIILVKLSQGLIGAENSYLLGACIVAKLQQCAMARQQQNAQDRVPFFCYIDEFHHFITESMNTMLSGARKFAFGLVLAHQDMQQVQRQDNDIASALMSNVGTRICFRLSDTDSKRMQDGFSGFNADDLQNLGVGEAIARVNAADADFNLRVVPFDGRFENRDEIISHSRSLYSTQLRQEQTEIKPIQPIAAQDVKAPTPFIKETPPKQDKPTTEEPQQREHLYLQSLIKGMAERQGYKAGIEVPTPDRSGYIDVVLEKGSERVAVEISVSTTVPWEVHNIQKCVAAGFTDIVVCASTEAKIQMIQKLVAQNAIVTSSTTIRYVTPEQIPTLFVPEQSVQQTPVTMKGYRVKVNYTKGSADTNDIVKEIVRRGRKS